MSTHLLQHPSRKESNNRKNSNNTHIPHPTLNPMLNNPQPNRNHTNKTNPILLQRKPILRRPNPLNLNLALAVRGPGGLVGGEEEEPDEDDGEGGDGEGDDEPFAPVEGDVHFLDCYYVLGGGDGGGLAAYVGC